MDPNFGLKLELTEEFSQTEAYYQLYMKLATDDEFAAKFINGIMPADLADQVAAEQKKGVDLVELGLVAEPTI